MRLGMGIVALLAAAAGVAPTIAEAQDSPRIIMRRPLGPATPTSSGGAACGSPGQPACPTDCDYTGAMWEVGQWTGAACGQNGTVTRSVRCVAVRADGQRVPKDDAFCLQDASAFASSCGTPSGNLPMLEMEPAR